LAIISAVTAVHAVLVAATVDSITLSAPAGPRIKIVNRDTSTPIYYRWDGIDPTIGGPESFIVPAGQSHTFMPSTTPAEVRMVATLGAAYSVLSLP